MTYTKFVVDALGRTVEEVVTDAKRRGNLLVMPQRVYRGLRVRRLKHGKILEFARHGARLVRRPQQFERPME